jgi:hypothetical protein
MGIGISNGFGWSQWKGPAAGRGLWGLKHSWWVLICLVYIVSPIDAIPDFIPVLGQMDDLGILAFMIFNAWQWFRSAMGTQGASSAPAGAIRQSPFAAPPTAAPVGVSEYEVKVTDQLGSERWVKVSAAGPDEARRSVAASGQYASVGRVRAAA